MCVLLSLLFNDFLSVHDVDAGGQAVELVADLHAAEVVDASGLLLLCRQAVDARLLATAEANAEGGGSRATSEVGMEGADAAGALGAWP